MTLPKHVLITIAFVHGIVSLASLIDLYLRSRRGKKTSWTLFVVLFPVVGVVAYELTKTRRKASRRVARRTSVHL